MKVVQVRENIFRKGYLQTEERDPFLEAEASIRKNSKTFHFATALLPAPKRRAIRALYGFCRATDDLVDVHRATHEQVEAWRMTVKRAPEHQDDPILYAWATTRSQFPVNPQFEDELITGVAFDIEPREYETWKDLETYCYHVASTVGLLSIPIVGLAEGTSFEQAAPYAVKLGVALQLTNILRDVGEDAARGRVYLPDTDLAQFGLSREEILAGVTDDRFRNLMKFEIKRARTLFNEALPGITMLSLSGRTAVGAAALLYRAILDEIEAIQYRVYYIRAHTSGLKKLAMLPRIVKTIANLRLPEPAQIAVTHMEDC